jgi:hypothetical protein
MRLGMKYIVPVWIAVFLISCAGAVSVVVSSQTVTAQLRSTASPVVFHNAVIGENYDKKNPETMRRFAQLQDNDLVTYRLLRGRHFFYFCYPASILLNDCVSKSQDVAIKMDGTAFFLLIENNANAPPLFFNEIL